ncbi:2-phosphosulfolactate phosphatase [candidate division KSB1 bacterium]|nr:MAG: 2-phosphosulfolactate phosphatase [candidate division KSB1 bacterium]
MKINLYFTPGEFQEEDLRDSTAVVVDVLRASTTICYALKNRCREIIPAAEVEEAVRLARQWQADDVLLCGEREGQRIEGFDLGNSPLEYKRSVVEDKILVHSSTNGSFVLVKAKASLKTYVAGFVNLQAVVKALLENGESVVILCAGKLGRFSIEDAVCAGMIVKSLQQHDAKIQIADSAVAAKILFEKYSSNILGLLQNCEHGRYLISLGLMKDLEVCAQVSTIDVVPTYRDGVIKKNMR